MGQECLTSDNAAFEKVAQGRDQCFLLGGGVHGMEVKDCVWFTILFTYQICLRSSTPVEIFGWFGGR
jgi:hypothetical protein